MKLMSWIRLTCSPARPKPARISDCLKIRIPTCDGRTFKQVRPLSFTGCLLARRRQKKSFAPPALAPAGMSNSPPLRRTCNQQISKCSKPPRCATELRWRHADQYGRHPQPSYRNGTPGQTVMPLRDPFRNSRHQSTVRSRQSNRPASMCRSRKWSESPPPPSPLPFRATPHGSPPPRGSPDLRSGSAHTIGGTDSHQNPRYARNQSVALCHHSVRHTVRHMRRFPNNAGMNLAQRNNFRRIFRGTGSKSMNHPFELRQIGCFDHGK